MSILRFLMNLETSNKSARDLLSLCLNLTHVNTQSWVKNLADVPAASSWFSGTSNFK